ncbi:MAG: recombinase zinc beta ribbon domain-containing protein [Bacteroidetes bacterium]|nr:recombinase zinc beta ribbon domain-containing protein [Bacteroidota bacterium]
MGKVFVPAYKGEPACLVKAVHEAIIPEALFYEVQDILEGRKNNERPKANRQKEELPLRGFLQCSKCGRPLTGSASKGSTARYYYYHCNFGCKERFRADKANEVFYDVLRAVSSNDKVFRSLELILGSENKEANSSRAEELAELKKKLETCEQRMERAQTLMLDGQMDFMEYQPIKSRLQEDIHRIQIKIEAIAGSKTKDEIAVMEYGFHFLQHMDKLFTTAALDVKRQIISSTFPEKLIFENNQYRTNSNNNVILLIAAMGKGFEKKKESKFSKNNLLSCRVVPTRIELVSKV